MVLEFLFNNLTLPSTILLSIVLPVLIYSLSGWFYNVYLHPLRRFPGPITWKASRLPYARHLFRGDLEKESVMGNMHTKYGKIVRIGPDILAFADARAWKDICAHKPGQAPNIKDMSHYGSPAKGTARGIVIADEQQHPRFRKLLAPAFNLQALQDQQPIIMKYIDMLVEGLKGQVSKGPVNVGAWMQWTTFDIIGDLTYAESFHGLETQSYHQWILNIFDWIKLGRLMGYIAAQYPVVQKLMPYVTPKSLTQKRVKHIQMGAAKVKKRLEEGETGRPDFMTLVLRNQGKENGLTLEELIPNAASMILAGSETTGTFMGGALFLLARNPAARQKATSEIRSHFASETEIEFKKVDKLPYLNAVIHETLRMYPPVPSGLDRVVTEPAGVEICGEHIPKGTRVSVHQLAAYTYEGCFHKAKSFIPERWLGDPEFADDERDLLQNFSYGPRDCIGRNLAYIEMRLILSRLLYSFDMELADPNFDWVEGQKIFGLWEKIPLMMNVKLAPRL